MNSTELPPLGRFFVIASNLRYWTIAAIYQNVNMSHL